MYENSWFIVRRGYDEQHNTTGYYKSLYENKDSLDGDLIYTLCHNEKEADRILEELIGHHHGTRVNLSEINKECDNAG